MHLNPTHAGTYIGQPVRLYVAMENSRGRKLFALRSIGGVIATAWDTARELRRFAAERYLDLTIDAE